jgi:hypothetical protein
MRVNEKALLSGRVFRYKTIALRIEKYAGKIELT